MVSRRSALGLLAGALALPSLAAEHASSPIAHGVLANNPLAKAFENAPGRFPRVTLWGPDGFFDEEFFRGRTILMPLWAEWCAPCLSELPDFAKLQAKYGNAKFQIIPVLTAAGRQAAPKNIAQIFRLLHAEALMPVVEKQFGSKLADGLARRGRSFVLPCNVLIGPDGVVIGREFGQVQAEDAKQGDAPAADGDAESVRRARAGQTQSLWGKAEGEEFAKAMAEGFLG